MASITGISAGRYYINNPVWLEADTTGLANTDSFEMTISANSVVLFQGKYYTNLQNKAYIDLSEIMKGLLPEPNHPTNPVSGDVINNMLFVQIYLLGFAPSVRFFRGGEDSDRTNIIVPANALLSESLKIPVWNGYPSAKYYVNNLGQIIYTDILTNAETERRPIVTCNPVFLRFLNSKGGYSFWLFDEWFITKNTKTTDVIERRDNDVDLGLTTTHQLALSTRAEERYTATLRALLQSPEVYIYRLDKVLIESNPQFVQTFTWTRIFNDGGSMKWNSFDSVNEFDFKFSLRLKTDPTLIW